MRDLWLVMAMAAVEQARDNAETWPVKAVPPIAPASIKPAKAKITKVAKAKTVPAVTIKSGSPAKQVVLKLAKVGTARTGAAAD